MPYYVNPSVKHISADSIENLQQAEEEAALCIREWILTRSIKNKPTRLREKIQRLCTFWLDARTFRLMNGSVSLGHNLLHDAYSGFLKGQWEISQEEKQDGVN